MCSLYRSSIQRTNMYSFYLACPYRLTNIEKVRRFRPGPQSSSPMTLTCLQIAPRLLYTPRLIQQIRLTLAVLARLPPRQGSGLGHLLLVDLTRRGVDAVLERLEQLDRGLGREVLVVLVVDLDHGRVDAGAQAFDFDEGEEAVGGGLALLDAEVGFDGVDDGVGAAAAELAGGLYTSVSLNSSNAVSFVFRPLSGA